MTIYKRKNNLQDFVSWDKHGIKYHYNSRNSSSLRRSKNKVERYWWSKGFREGWLRKFKFERLISRSRWSDFERWKIFGINKNYTVNSSNLSRSKEKTKRAWYKRGWKAGWLPKFKFERNRVKSGTWSNLDYCLQIARNIKKEECLTRFPSTSYLIGIGYGGLSAAIVKEHGGFAKFRKLLGEEDVITTADQLEDFLNKNQDARYIGSLVSISENIGDVADVLINLWPERFPSAAQLAKSLPGAISRIGDHLQPFTLGKASGFYEKLGSVPKRVYTALDDLLYGIIAEQYQIPFNEDPKGTLREVSKFAQGKNRVASLAKRVLDYYQQVYSFEVPGHGSIEDLRRSA